MGIEKQDKSIVYSTAPKCLGIEKNEFVDSVTDFYKKLIRDKTRSSETQIQSKIDELKIVYKGIIPLYVPINIEGVVYPILKDTGDKQINRFLEHSLEFIIGFEYPEKAGTELIDTFNELTKQGFDYVGAMYANSIRNILSENKNICDLKGIIDLTSKIENYLLKKDPNYDYGSFFRAQELSLKDKNAGAIQEYSFDVRIKDMDLNKHIIIERMIFQNQVAKLESITNLFTSPHTRNRYISTVIENDKSEAAKNILNSISNLELRRQIHENFLEEYLPIEDFEK